MGNHGYMARFLLVTSGKKRGVRGTHPGGPYFDRVTHWNHWGIKKVDFFLDIGSAVRRMDLDPRNTGVGGLVPPGFFDILTRAWDVASLPVYRPRPDQQ